MNGTKLLGIISICATAMACAHQAPAPVAAPAAPAEAPAEYYNQEMLQGVLWMQHSVEYRASSMQAYAAATRALDAALADPAWNAVSEQWEPPAGQLPPAVILDIDETCVDNSVYEAELLLAKQLHTEEHWDAFVRSGKVSAVPGAREFLQHAAARGVTIYYVTNQNVKLEEATRANLAKLGFPLDSARDTLLMVAERPDWSSDKASRRLFVAKEHRVLLLLGDDFNDFVTANGKTPAERDAIFDRFAPWFGSKWFVLPNPVYGSWERALLHGAGKSARERFDAKIKALRTTAD